MKLEAIFKKFPSGYAALVKGLPGANSQGTTLPGARINLKEAIALVLKARRDLGITRPSNRSILKKTSAKGLNERSGVSAERRKSKERRECGFLPKAATPFLPKSLKELNPPSC